MKKAISSTIKVLFILLALILCKLQPIEAQSGLLEKSPVQGLDSLVNKVIADWKVPGLSLAIISNGKVIYINSYGVKNLGTSDKVNNQTLFSIASSTKSFTATATAMLVEEKKIEWDTPLKKYFPDFSLYDEMATDKITIKDLFSMRSGISRQKYYSLVAPVKRIDTRYDMKYFQPGADFRSTFQYCNEVYAVGGDMVAELDGTSWEDMVQKRIFEPLGMTSSIFSYKNLTNRDFATPYIEREEGIQELQYHNADMLGGAGCIISNIEDMSKWVLFNLNKGKVNDKQLLKPMSLTQIYAPILYVPGSSRYKEVINQCYGIGWFSDSYRGYRRVHHGGVLYGFSGLVSMLTNENIGVVVLSNLNGSPVPGIIESYIYDSFLGLKPIDWNQRNIDENQQMKAYYKSMEAKSKDTETKIPASLPLKSYAGRFVSKGYGTIVITEESDSLITNLLGINCPIHHLDQDVFECYHPVEDYGWELRFIVDVKNKVESFEVKLVPNINPIIYKREE